ncbi:Transmembrane component of general energizing module of ECF transporter [Streptococcus sp. DD10]|nr:Transmembrane component of general energizing module of ECF transporter [Streptococcus sp. DD10]
MVLFVFIIFWANNLTTNGLLLLFIVGLVKLSRISLKFFISSLKSVIFLVAFTSLFQLFFTTVGNSIFEWGIVRVTDYGLSQAGIVFSRFILIVLFSTLLTLTTMPLSLADAVESLLSPLKVLKVPVHEIGLMLSMSLRFVPTLMDDTVRIMNAQRARGIEFNEGNIVKKIRAIIPILIPLFASSFKRADNLAIAMEARGYQGGENRTRYRQLQWYWRDWLAMIVMVLLAFLLYWLKN